MAGALRRLVAGIVGNFGLGFSGLIPDPLPESASTGATSFSATGFSVGFEAFAERVSTAFRGGSGGAAAMRKASKLLLAVGSLGAAERIFRGANVLTIAEDSQRRASTVEGIGCSCAEGRCNGNSSASTSSSGDPNSMTAKRKSSNFANCSGTALGLPVNCRGSMLVDGRIGKPAIGRGLIEISQLG